MWVWHISLSLSRLGFLNFLFYLEIRREKVLPISDIGLSVRDAAAAEADETCQNKATKDVVAEKVIDIVSNIEAVEIYSRDCGWPRRP